MEGMEMHSLHLPNVFRASSEIFGALCRYIYIST